MSEIVNLNRARKAKARLNAAARAKANRIVFGLTKAKRAAARERAAQTARTLDAHKREP